MRHGCLSLRTYLKNNPATKKYKSLATAAAAMNGSASSYLLIHFALRRNASLARAQPRYAIIFEVGSNFPYTLLFATLRRMIDTKQYKERLEKELVQVESELKTVGRKNPQNPKDWEPTAGKSDDASTEWDERADKIEEYEDNAGILKNLEIRWNNIKKALEKIAEGTYGTCDVSGEEIEKERLDANPAALTCTKHMGDEAKLS